MVVLIAGSPRGFSAAISSIAHPNKWPPDVTIATFNRLTMPAPVWHHERFLVSETTLLHGFPSTLNAVVDQLRAERVPWSGESW
jgi:hypothetical protein